MARVLISMPESFLGKIDEVAENESRTRSELIREALRSYITRSQVRQNTLADKNARILEALLDQRQEMGNFPHEGIQGLIGIHKHEKKLRTE